MMDVCLLGNGGMLPLPGRALTALYVRCGGQVVLIDCGEGTQTAIRAAGLRMKPIGTILITHFHADHISGLPGLLLTLGNEGRTEDVHIYGPEGLERVVNALRVIVPELPYPLHCHEWKNESCGTAICAGMDVTAFPLDHGTPCFGYCLELKRPGKFDPQRAKDNGVPMALWNRLQRGEAVEGFSSEDVLGQPRRGLRLTYATDSRPVENMVTFGRNADLLILEGMFGEPEKLGRAEVTHHMLMQEAAQIAKRAGAQQLWLTHFSPATPEPEEFLPQVQEIFPHTAMGVAGCYTCLRFREEQGPTANTSL